MGEFHPPHRVARQSPLTLPLRGRGAAAPVVALRAYSEGQRPVGSLCAHPPVPRPLQVIRHSGDRSGA